jgi:hypothetical protein
VRNIKQDPFCFNVQIYDILVISQNLFLKLDKRDKEIFNSDMETVDWSSCIKASMSGLRHYVLKEDPKTIPQVKMRLQRFV